MKSLIFMLVLSFSSLTSAESCIDLIRNENPNISLRVGQGLMNNPMTGGILFNPGTRMTFEDKEHWSYIFESAIFYGISRFGTDEDNKKREDLLKKFQDSISENCPALNAQNTNEPYVLLRSMMKELVEDGSFCPGNKLPSRLIWNSWGGYKKVLESAVLSGQFSEECSGVAAADDSSREIKDVNQSPERSVSEGSQAQGQ